MMLRIIDEADQRRELPNSELQRLSSRWIEAIHRPSASFEDDEPEEIQEILDKLIELRATDSVDLSSKLLAALATSELSVGRDHVLTHLLSSIVLDQNAVAGVELQADVSPQSNKA